MAGTIGAAHQFSAGFQHAEDFGKGPGQIFRIKEYVIGNDQVKEIAVKGDVLAVEPLKED